MATRLAIKKTIGDVSRLKNWPDRPGHVLENAQGKTHSPDTLGDYIVNRLIESLNR